MPNPENIAVIGARRKRQGTGGHIAAAFTRQGCRVRAIIGTGRDSVAQALAELRRQGIEASGYLRSDELFANEEIGLLVIATPPEHHLEYIEQGLRNGCHVFCEKPLWAPIPDLPASAASGKAAGLLRRFEQLGLHLCINAQWPHTLPVFRKLHPKVSLAPQDVKSFAMDLCPESFGVAMITDAAPHLLSMLFALLGHGELNRCRVTLDGHKAEIEFEYRHKNGETRVVSRLTRQSGQPKPAAYSINGCRIERHVEMDNYALSFSAGDNRLPAPDPLELSVAQCLSAIRNQSRHDDEIPSGIGNLHRLVEAAGARNSP